MLEKTEMNTARGGYEYGGDAVESCGRRGCAEEDLGKRISMFFKHPCSVAKMKSSPRQPGASLFVLLVCVTVWEGR